MEAKLGILVGISSLLMTLALNLFSAQSYEWQTIASIKQLDSALVPWVEKINGVDQKYFPGKKLLVPKDTLAGKSYSPLPHYDSLLTAEDSVIVVFLGHSLFGVYEQGNLVYWGPITRGKKITYTPQGEYYVRRKARLVISEKYGGVPMPYALLLFGHIYIHQGSMVGRGASHGCVRLFKRDAKWLYAWAHLGTKVIIKI